VVPRLTAAGLIDNLRIRPIRVRDWVDTRSDEFSSLGETICFFTLKNAFVTRIFPSGAAQFTAPGETSSHKSVRSHRIFIFETCLRHVLRVQSRYGL
jgi:hypothetical protein